MSIKKFEQRAFDTLVRSKFPLNTTLHLLNICRAKEEQAYRGSAVSASTANFLANQGMSSANGFGQSECFPCSILRVTFDASRHVKMDDVADVCSVNSCSSSASHRGWVRLEWQPYPSRKQSLLLSINQHLSMGSIVPRSAKKLTTRLVRFINCSWASVRCSASNPAW